MWSLCDEYETVVIGLLVVPLFAVIGVIVGSYLTHKSAQELFSSRRERELRERSYSTLMGLKIPLSQTQQTLMEAKLLTEFYDHRYRYMSKDQFDLDMSQSENTRMLALIPEFTALQRELAAALGDVRISYQLITPELEEAVEAVRRYRTVTLQPLDPTKIKTPEQLDAWKEQAGEKLVSLLRSEWNDKIDHLLPLMFAQIKRR